MVSSVDAAMELLSSGEPVAACLAPSFPAALHTYHELLRTGRHTA